MEGVSPIEDGEDRLDGSSTILEIVDGESARLFIAVVRELFLPESSMNLSYGMVG